MTPLSAQQRRALQRQTKDAPPADAKVTEFLEAFCFFEALVRTIGKYYRARNGALPKSEVHEPLNLDVVDRSFKHFGIALSAQELNLLLSSGSRKRGSKSARNLRNGVVHTWAKEDRTEICDRFARLKGVLDRGVEAIQRRTKSL